MSTVCHYPTDVSDEQWEITFFMPISRWREIRACNDNTCGESKGQNSHRSLLDLTCLIAATDPKALIY
jgi:hypothetical protein